MLLFEQRILIISQTLDFIARRMLSSYYIEKTTKIQRYRMMNSVICTFAGFLCLSPSTSIVASGILLKTPSYIIVAMTGGQSNSNKTRPETHMIIAKSQANPPNQLQVRVLNKRAKKVQSREKVVRWAVLGHWGRFGALGQNL